MRATYALAPFVGYLVAGSLKFAINTVRARRPAFAEMGYGGLPSTHTTVVTTPAALIALRDGIDSPAFAVAAALALIVMLDAMDLRRHLERHARALNAACDGRPGFAPVRERLGHRPLEVLAGVATGCVCAALLSRC